MLVWSAVGCVEDGEITDKERTLLAERSDVSTGKVGANRQSERSKPVVRSEQNQRKQDGEIKSRYQGTTRNTY